MQTKHPLTPKQVEELLPRIGLSYKAIARRADTSDTTVRRVLLKYDDGKFYSEDTAQKIYAIVRDAIAETIKTLQKYQFMKKAA